MNINGTEFKAFTIIICNIYLLAKNTPTHYDTNKIIALLHKKQLEFVNLVIFLNIYIKCISVKDTAYNFILKDSLNRPWCSLSIIEILNIQKPFGSSKQTAYT